ncbi:hypothetical protein T4C_1826 [Trichinella pseudospiralis]|uniref:Uncharacterized protein n=1 Tax=Trichinella pseudospiralis TaxID=6337 RepID=A0A0V1KHQ5_TRIPS|nr:hypothetical protein T4C_1826 [Trichinella pseudospiralis]
MKRSSFVMGGKTEHFYTPISNDDDNFNLHSMETHFQLVAVPLLLKIFRARQDSNLQSSDPKSDALSVTPRALMCAKDLKLKLNFEHFFDKY